MWDIYVSFGCLLGEHVIHLGHRSDSCRSGIAFTCWGRSYADLQARNAALCVTASDPESVAGVGLQVSHRQPAACCCTSIQHSIPI